MQPPKHGGVYVVAHRGVHNGIPENTLPAYQRAIDIGADFVEIDVRTSKDGAFVSVHNAEIDAYVPGVTGEIKNFTLAELKGFDVGKRVGPQWQGTRIPTFAEVLDLCNGKIGIYLDLKDAPVRPLVEMVRIRRMTRQVLWYADDAALREVQAWCPECIIMPDPGPAENLPAVIAEWHPVVVATVWRHYSAGFAATCHRSGAIVIVDEDGKACWQPALEWLTDGIQTDDPEALIAFLQKRDD
jgi:glycerophosphoryl diester phosphodiesterase